MMLVFKNEDLKIILFQYSQINAADCIKMPFPLEEGWDFIRQTLSQNMQTVNLY